MIFFSSCHGQRPPSFLPFVEEQIPEDTLHVSATCGHACAQLPLAPGDGAAGSPVVCQRAQ